VIGIEGAQGASRWEKAMRHLLRLFAGVPDREGGSAAHGNALLTTVLKLVLGAAIVTAPLYVVGEGFDLSHVGRVLLINGGTAIGALILLLLAQRGYDRVVSAVTVWGLYALVSWLAATNGEPIHTNVVNFVVILVLANLLLSGRGVVIAALACATAMVGIAYHQALMTTGGQYGELLVETVVQFLPQFILIALLLRMTLGRSIAALPSRTPAAR
jgi:hypothetical protein